MEGRRILRRPPSVAPLWYQMLPLCVRDSEGAEYARYQKCREREHQIVFHIFQHGNVRLHDK